MAKRNQNSGSSETRTGKIEVQQKKSKSAQFGLPLETVKRGVPVVGGQLVDLAGVPSSAVVNSAILATTKQRPESKMTSLEKMELASKGISKKGLEQLKNKAALSYDQLAKILSVSRATLINKKENAVFNQELSEKIVAIATIYSYGYEVFEDEARFNNWISRPNRALGYKAPYDLLSSSFGREEVENIIGRIAYGVYS